MKNHSPEFRLKAIRLEQQAGELMYWLGLFTRPKASDDPEIPILLTEGTALHHALTEAIKSTPALMTPLSAQDTLKLAQFALDHAADEASLWTDTEGRLLYVNEAACRTLGRTSQDLLKMTSLQVSPELTPNSGPSSGREIKTRPHFAFELILRAKDNRVFLLR